MDEFQRPQDMMPHKKGGQMKTMDLSMGQHKLHHRRLLNLNIYSSRDIERTKNDDNYQKRIDLKELIFYMERDPQFRKSQILY